MTIRRVTFPGDWSTILARLGFGLALAGYCGALSVSFLALPLFGNIIWFQSEPVVAGLHVFSGVVGVGLGLIALGRPRTLRLFRHPLVLVPLALAVWTGLVGMVQKLPFQGWFGSVEVGEGLIQYLELGILVAAAIAIMRLRRLRLALAGTAVVVVLAVALMTWAWNENLTETITPYFFPDYAAFFGIFIFPVVAVTLWLEGWKRLGWVLGVAAGVGVVLVSRNWTAYLLVMAGGPVIWMLATYLPFHLRVRRKLATTGTFLTPVAITALLLPTFFETLSEEANLLGRLANSVLSRHRLADVVVEAAKADPSLFLLGSGWGSYSDLLAVHLPTKWAILRDVHLLIGKLWDAVLRVDFHSHNQVLEAFIGGGLIAVVLSLAVVALLPSWCRGRYFALASVTAVSTGGLLAFWFQFPVSVPFMALAWGTLASNPPRFSLKLRVPKALLVVGVIGIGLGLVYFGVTAGRLARDAFFFQPAMEGPLFVNGQRQTCPALLDDQGRGGLHLAHRLKTVSGYAAKVAAETEKFPVEIAYRMRGLICATEEEIDRGARFRLLVTSLLARFDLAFAPSNPKLDPVTAEFLSNWEQRLTQAMAIAPNRTDLAAPYLLWLLKEGRTETLRAWAGRLYTRDSDDPVGLWFSGIAQLEDPILAPQGIERMKKGLKLGIERFIPIEDSIKEELTR